MTITNGYATLADLKATLGITDRVDDTELESAIEAASRQIEAHCGRGRKFWQDTSAVARTYYPRTSRLCYVDDISTKTGLVVKADTGDDGTFATTLTIDDDFIVQPINADVESPVRPWTCVVLLSGSATAFTSNTSGRPFLEVTAQFGWPAVPEAVRRACLIQAKSIFKSQDATFGSFALSIDGQPQRVPSFDPIARAQLEPFVRFEEVDDGA